jgi:hypothetical protein
MSPWDALPEHIDEPGEWAGTDDDTWLMRWRLKIKGWFAYSYRSRYWWARWRKTPIVLFAVRGKGLWRFENDVNDLTCVDLNPCWKSDERPFYLSRVQYYCRWHFKIMWPLFIAGHVYPKAADVPKPGEPVGDAQDGKLYQAYAGAARDADQVYWFPSAATGKVWK